MRIERRIEVGERLDVGFAVASREAVPLADIGRGELEDAEAQVFGRLARGERQRALVGVGKLSYDAADALFADLGDGRVLRVASRLRQLHHDEATVATIFAVQFQHSLCGCRRAGEEV